MPAIRTSLVVRLQQIAQLLIDPHRPSYSLRAEILELKSIYARAAGAFSDPDDIATGQTITPNGVAISPTMASMCVDDYARTVQFIRGTHDAVRDLHGRIDERPVRVLYAGCGSWATLAVPLMTVFGGDMVTFSLLDIHPESVASVTALIGTLGLSDHVDTLSTDDAASYSIDPNSRPDIVIVEMIRAGLEAEPQIAVSRNLMQQAPDAILIPESIRIDLSLVNSAREFSLGDSAEVSAQTDRDRVSVGTVFVVNKETVCAEELIGSILSLPEFDETRYDPMLLTTVQVYGENWLRDYESGITLPKTLPVETKVKPGDTIQFRYELGSLPRITATLLPDR